MSGVTIWPTAQQAQEAANRHGNAHTRVIGHTFLCVPNNVSDLDADAAAQRVNSGVRRSDPETSRAAAIGVNPTDRTIAYNIHRAHPDGLTDDQLAELMGRRPTSAGKRRLELVEAGLIEATAERRPTRTGSSAIVWRAVAS